MIKSLEMQGFKSFNKKVVIPLSEGLTAFVGPNGSGKSNICDSICFVLGRSSARSMRAERLAHLIYNGGKGNPPATAMEVTLVLDNKKRELPFENDEVRVTRRLTRNGTMSYKVNNQKCTKQQMVDLLSSHMFKASGHNIVLQGDVTNFIEMDPFGRRQVLDEICGISEYDEKRDKAQKDLGAVEVHIKEIVIVMSERKKHVESLRKEKEDAEKYKALKDEAAGLEGQLAFTKLKNAEVIESKIQEKISLEQTEEQKFASEFSDINNKLTEKQSRKKGIDTKLIHEGSTEQVGVKFEAERIKGRISINESKIESKQSEISRIDGMVSNLQARSSTPARFISNLKSEIEGIHGTVSELMTHDAKYASAIENSLGKRSHFVIVDSDDTAIKCVNFLRENSMGRATFLPLNKIQPPKEIRETNGAGIIGLALNLVKYDSKFDKAFQYAFGNTHIVEDIDKVKSHIGKIRMVSLLGDIAERAGSISGGSQKRGKKGSGSEIEEYVKTRDKLLDEIEDLSLSNEALKKEYEDYLKKDKEVGNTMESMQRDSEVLDLEIDKLREKCDQVRLQKESATRKISDIRIEKAQIDAKLTDIRLNMEKFKDMDFEEGDIEKMDERLIKVNNNVIKLEPVNMKAIELYGQHMKEFQVFEEKFNTLKSERNSIIDFIEDIEKRKKEVFFEVFNKVGEEFSQVFPKLSPEGEARLIIEDPEDPLASGLFVEAKPAGKKILSIDSLSGGEKTMTALAFLIALQSYKPSPFYVLDEVDAALDQANSMRFVTLMQERAKKSQLLIISHNNSVVRNAERLFGVSMQSDGTSKLVGIEIGTNDEIAEKEVEEPKMEEIIEDEAEGSGQEAVEESNEPMLEDIPLELPNLEPEAPTETPIENLDVPNLDSPQEVPVEQPEKPPQGE
ncbi:MAG: AAA family ATPase [Candidatus Undinarchaeales archaeon]|nr:AAA family ATPase [Candidatus Undinarchaeales archaeon]